MNDLEPAAAAAFPDEALHLREVLQLLAAAFARADASLHRIDGEYTDLKRYMTENRGEIDPHEMLQNEQTLAHIDRSGAQAADTRERIARLIDSPYFARVDFLPRQEQTETAYYIGRYGFLQGNRQWILDWRAPIAGMFYDCEIGPAAYTAPSGRVQGRLVRKRQYKISRGEMEYVLDSSLNIHDDVLQRELSRTSDDKMKSIISTIQKEQNRVIREENAETLIIQGAAGSGKTSVALHRIAYLLYRFRGSLTARNVAVLSPNLVFGDYISGVLPELGEEPVFTFSLADIAEIQLEGVVRFQRDEDPLDREDPAWAERNRYKSTAVFLERLEDFRRQTENDVFMAADYPCGRFTVSAGWIQARFSALAPDPVMRRLQKIADAMYDRLKTERALADALPAKAEIVKALRGMLRVKTSLALYGEFYKRQHCAAMLAMPDSKTLEWADVYPYIYLRGAFEGNRESPAVRHLVIDEMQDYTPVQYAVLNRLFRCRKTILGDFGQRINPHHLHTLADIRRMFEGAVYVELNKSYRSTWEISRFAARIRRSTLATAIARHGEEPLVRQCASRQEELGYLRKRVCAFAGGGSMGLIAKTERAADALFAQLSELNVVYRISQESRHFRNGVCVVSVYMSKGLEFDEVIVPSADAETYRTESDGGLLYVACTRAMHRLTLTHTGRRTALLGADA